MPRVRFAPSPTGYLHIGSARTFIFNWLYARKHNGTMILRLDDTDVERNTQASVDSIFDGLHWLGLNWDEYYRQSERLALHKEMAHRILAQGRAYRDFTPAQTGEEERSEAGEPWLFHPEMRELSPAESDRRAAAGEPFVLRFRVPRGENRAVKFKDSVFGDQYKKADEIEDFALLRSNGMPTYHMASCADDVDLRIDHIIRGQDHLTNTFKHVLIFEALCETKPKFAHLPLLIAPDGAKLSKRKHGPVVSVTTYRDAGFLPQAYINFLCLLGWSPKNNREQMAIPELIEAFSFSGVNRSNAVVNFSDEDPIDPKAQWLNGQHLRSMALDGLLPAVRATLEAAGLHAEEANFAFVVDTIRARYTSLHDFATKGLPYFSDEFPMEPAAAERLDEPRARELLRTLGARLAAATEFTEASVETTLRELAAEAGVKPGVLINGSRAALTGQAVGPSAFHVFTAIGRERSIARLTKV
ncbi:MAG: glutamate--tRNA ligase [Acidobacteriota bacterium]|jgi:glutamyl-tRNA synthetase|nr:glutamate--tRNA ligase [Acidobacteriaceae bacterium]